MVKLKFVQEHVWRSTPTMKVVELSYGEDDQEVLLSLMDKASQLHLLVCEALDIKPNDFKSEVESTNTLSKRLIVVLVEKRNN